jgi:two-component system sensor histidine kinase AtoS
MLEKIFEPDFSTNEYGTGLGLAISRKIITAHHGEIFAKSFPGGSIFTIRLPTYIGESI